MRAFNIAGPCFPDTHYMLPPERRLGEIMELVELGHYFTLHAGRQTGKTTSAQWLVEHYNAGDRFAAVWVDVQVARERALTYIQQMQIAEDPAAFVRPGGELDMPKLMTAWQTFWRKDGHLAAEGFGYRESGPHLMLMVFLQRVINGGGRVEREYGLGKGALDLMIEWRDERHAIEVKLRRDTETEADALEQVARYLDRAGLEEGWLVMLDLRTTLPWTERLTQRVIDAHGKRVHMVGC